ncbi:MAG: diguanylate cyclase [Anaerolineales bacterium]|nr:diguanylate cyclase [Anaerolineales bacterium]
MKDFSWQTKTYIILTIVTGFAIFASLALNSDWGNYLSILALSSLASVTLFFKVEGTTNRSHYNISFMVYGFTLALLGVEACIVVIVTSNLVDWAWHKSPWFIQGFNIASFVIVAYLSGFLYQFINPSMSLVSLEGVLGIITSLAFFTLFNHLLIALVVWLARGENFSKSGLFDVLPLMIDFTLLCMGAGAALIWIINPFAIPLAILPLYLIFTTLKVPALERKTEIDSKTGLYNAKYFSKVLKKELERAHNFDRPLTVVLADLDLLRNINNTYGHLAGDEVLIGVANLLKDSLREFDVVARFGGEEFIILMPETTQKEAFQVIEEIRTTIDQTKFSIQTRINPIKVTVSFGVAGRIRFSETPNEIIHNADSALYHSKLSGRNRTCVYTDQGFEVLYEPGDEIPLDRISLPVENITTHSKLENTPHSLPKKPSQIEPGSKNPEPPPQPDAKPRPSWLINLFIGILILVAFPLSLFINAAVPGIDWFGLVLFALMVVVTEVLSIDIYVKNTSVSTSAAPILAGTLLYGPIGAVVLGLTFALVAKFKHHSPLNRFVFNSINQIIAGLLLSGLILLAGKTFTDYSLIVQLLISVISALLVFLSTTILIALAINIDAGISFRQVWKEKFSWLTPYYISMGLIAYALILGYQTTGFIGLAVIMIPLLMLRLSVKQYIDRTISMVNELRGKNQLLESSSDQISLLNEDLLIALAEVIDLRDPFTLGHSQYVTRYSVLIAKKLGLPPESIELIRKAGLLHDIGKIGIPDAILLKPFPLTEKEYQIIQRHTTLGSDILEKAHSLKHLAPIVRHHHERYDGSGYPDRLKGQDTPIEARIIAIADAVEAMASDRPYRRALSFNRIEEELIRNSGSQFDPMIIETMLQILQERNEYLLVNSAEKLTVEQCEYAFVNPEAHSVVEN